MQATGCYSPCELAAFNVVFRSSLLLFSLISSISHALNPSFAVLGVARGRNALVPRSYRFGPLPSTADD